MLKYQLLISWSEEDQAFLAAVPELPGCVADGATYQEVVANVEVAIREWIETAQSQNRPIPEPETVEEAEANRSAVDERLTDRARLVLRLADQEARQLGHEYVGTEHVLLALIRERAGVAANVLMNLGVSAEVIDQEVSRIVPPGQGRPRPGTLPLTPRTKVAINYAAEEAGQLKHDYVGTEHLLLGLLRGEEGVAAQVLRQLGLRREEVREEVFAMLGIESVPAPQRASRATKKRKRWREYDLYLPLTYNDGTPVEPEKIERLKKRVHDRFGGFTFFPQKSEGVWRVGNVVFREEIVILHVLSDEPKESKAFFLQLKGELMQDLKQNEVLIIMRKVEVL